MACLSRPGRLGDQPRRPVSCQVVPAPLQEHQQAILELDQVDQVDEEPDQPGRKTVQPQSANLCHGRRAANHRHAAAVAVAKRRRGPAAQSAGDQACRVGPLLHGHRSDAGQRPTVGLPGVGQIAQHEDLGMARDTQVRPDDHAALTVEFRAGRRRESGSQRRRLHARSPDDGPRRDRFRPLLVAQGHTIRPDVRHDRSGVNRHAQSFQRFAGGLGQLLIIGG